MYTNQNGNAADDERTQTMQTNLSKTNLYNALADGILKAAAERIGYAREDLDRVIEALAMHDEAHRIILDTLCCAACGPVASWDTYADKAAEQIASAISEREFASDLKIDMTKGA